MRKPSAKQVTSPSSNSTKTVELLRRAYDVKKKSNERKMTIQTQKPKKMAGVKPDAELHQKASVVTAVTMNRVFNINVVTEDGRTEHEDYPHEIDLQNYPQYQERPLLQ